MLQMSRDILGQKLIELFVPDWKNMTIEDYMAFIEGLVTNNSNQSE